MSKKELNLSHDGEEASPWDEYIAPQDLKQGLQARPRKFDPSFLDTLQRAREQMYREPDDIAQGTPLVLFCGPPGTGKPMQCVHLAW